MPQSESPERRHGLSSRLVRPSLRCRMIARRVGREYNVRAAAGGHAFRAWPGA
jgi:hypothetical protein